MISLATLDNSKNMYNTAGFLYLIQTYCHHICLSHDIPMVTTSAYFIILTSLIVLREVLMIHHNIYLLIRNHMNPHFVYQLLWVQMSHEDIISKTLKNHVICSNNSQKNHFYDLTANFGQLHNHVQHSVFYVVDRYILSPHLLIS